MHLKRSARFFWLCAVLGTGLASPAFGASVSLRPTADTTLQSAYADYNFGDGNSFTAGGRLQGGITRALMLYDIAGNLPSGAVISSVSLSLSVVSSRGSASIFDLNRVTAAWGEGNGSDHGGSPGLANQATWNNRLGAGTPWITPGGDYFTTASGSRSINGPGTYVFASTASLVSDVQGWFNSPSSNFGWLLRSESELTAGTIRRFGAHNDAVNSPVLTIQYTVIPEPAAGSLLVVGLALAAHRSRRCRKSPEHAI